MKKRGFRISKRRMFAYGLAVFAFLILAHLTPKSKTDINQYWNTAQRAFNQEIDPYPLYPGDRLPFIYPPSGILMFLPYAHLTMDEAAKGMFVLNCVLVIVVLMGLIIRDLSRSGAHGRLATWGPLFVALYGGVHVTIALSQVNIIMLGFLWMYWRRLREGAPSATAGVGLVLGSAAKPHYGLLLALAAPRFGRNLVLGVVAASICLFAATLLLLPNGVWDSWLVHIAGHTSYTELPEGHRSIAVPWNRSLPGLVARFMVPNPYSNPAWTSAPLASAISSAAVLGLFAATGLAVIRSMRCPGRDALRRDLELAAVTLALFLASPASWTHHLVMLLPAALLALRDFALNREAAWWSRFGVGIVLAVMGLTLDEFLSVAARASSLLVMSLVTFSVAALWSITVGRLFALASERRDRRIGPRVPSPAGTAPR